MLFILSALEWSKFSWQYVVCSSQEICKQLELSSKVIGCQVFVSSDYYDIVNFWFWIYGKHDYRKQLWHHILSVRWLSIGTCYITFEIFFVVHRSRPGYFSPHSVYTPTSAIIALSWRIGAVFITSSFPIFLTFCFSGWEKSKNVRKCWHSRACSNQD